MERVNWACRQHVARSTTVYGQLSFTAGHSLTKFRHHNDYYTLQTSTQYHSQTITLSSASSFASHAHWCLFWLGVEWAYNTFKGCNHMNQNDVAEAFSATNRAQMRSCKAVSWQLRECSQTRRCMAAVQVDLFAESSPLHTIESGRHCSFKVNTNKNPCV